MIPAPISPAPPSSKRDIPRPGNWRWDESLEYDRNGFLLPPRRTLLERVYVWICELLRARRGERGF
jgi:hypothetical protein